ARLWARRYADARGVDGQTIVLNGTPYPIVGVLPAGFGFVRAPEPPDVWLPLGLDPFADRKYARGANALGVLARLRPGVTIAQALAESAALATVGGAAAMFVASWIVRLPAAAALVAPTLFTPFSVGRDDVSVDGRVFAFAAIVTLGTGMVVGILPALRLSALA